MVGASDAINSGGDVQSMERRGSAEATAHFINTNNLKAFVLTL